MKWGLLLPNPVICQENADVSKTLLDFGCRILIFQMLLSVLTFVLSFKYISFVVTEEKMGDIFANFKIYFSVKLCSCDKTYVHFVKIF